MMPTRMTRSTARRSTARHSRRRDHSPNQPRVSDHAGFFLPPAKPEFALVALQRNHVFAMVMRVDDQSKFPIATRAAAVLRLTPVRQARIRLVERRPAFRGAAGGGAGVSMRTSATGWGRSMFRLVDTRDPDAVLREVQAIYTAMYPAGDHGFVARAFGWVRDCFEGRHPGYLPIDARYHDLEHTMQGTIGLAQLLQGRQAAGAAPPVNADEFRLGLLPSCFTTPGISSAATTPKGRAPSTRRSTSSAARRSPRSFSGPRALPTPTCSPSRT